MSLDEELTPPSSPILARPMGEMGTEREEDAQFDWLQEALCQFDEPHPETVDHDAFRALEMDVDATASSLSEISTPLLVCDKSCAGVNSRIHRHSASLSGTNDETLEDPFFRLIDCSRSGQLQSLNYLPGLEENRIFNPSSIFCDPSNFLDMFRVEMAEILNKCFSQKGKRSVAFIVRTPTADFFDLYRRIQAKICFLRTLSWISLTDRSLASSQVQEFFSVILLKTKHILMDCGLLNDVPLPSYGSDTNCAELFLHLSLEFRWFLLETLYLLCKSEHFSGNLTMAEYCLDVTKSLSFRTPFAQLSSSIHWDLGVLSLRSKMDSRNSCGCVNKIWKAVCCLSHRGKRDQLCDGPVRDADILTQWLSGDLSNQYIGKEVYSDIFYLPGTTSETTIADGNRNVWIFLDQISSVIGNEDEDMFVKVLERTLVKSGSNHGLVWQWTLNRISRRLTSPSHIPIFRSLWKIVMRKLNVRTSSLDDISSLARVIPSSSEEWSNRITEIIHLDLKNKNPTVSSWTLFLNFLAHMASDSQNRDNIYSRCVKSAVFGNLIPKQIQSFQPEGLKNLADLFLILASVFDMYDSFSTWQKLLSQTSIRNSDTEKKSILLKAGGTFVLLCRKQGKDCSLVSKEYCKNVQDLISYHQHVLEDRVLSSSIRDILQDFAEFLGTLFADFDKELCLGLHHILSVDWRALLLIENVQNSMLEIGLVLDGMVRRRLETGERSLDGGSNVASEMGPYMRFLRFELFPSLESLWRKMGSAKRKDAMSNPGHRQGMADTLAKILGRLSVLGKVWKRVLETEQSSLDFPLIQLLHLVSSAEFESEIPMESIFVFLLEIVPLMDGGMDGAEGEVVVIRLWLRCLFLLHLEDRGSEVARLVRGIFSLPSLRDQLGNPIDLQDQLHLNHSMKCLSLLSEQFKKRSDTGEIERRSLTIAVMSWMSETVTILSHICKTRRELKSQAFRILSRFLVNCPELLYPRCSCPVGKCSFQCDQTKPGFLLIKIINSVLLIPDNIKAFMPFIVPTIQNCILRMPFWRSDSTLKGRIKNLFVTYTEAFAPDLGNSDNPLVHVVTARYSTPQENCEIRKVLVTGAVERLNSHIRTFVTSKTHSNAAASSAVVLYRFYGHLVQRTEDKTVLEEELKLVLEPIFLGILDVRVHSNVHKYSFELLRKLMDALPCSVPNTSRNIIERMLERKSFPLAAGFYERCLYLIKYSSSLREPLLSALNSSMKKNENAGGLGLLREQREMIRKLERETEKGS